MSGGNHCKHYSGREIMLGNEKKCKAGIDPVFSYCDGSYSGWIKRAPCFKDNVDAPHCPAAVFPTQEEVAAEYAAFEVYLENFMKYMPVARENIIVIVQETGKHSGMTKCPKCGGLGLRWTHSTVNGHIHAQCKTADCLGWME